MASSASSSSAALGGGRGGAGPGSASSSAGPISRSRVPTMPKLLYGTAWKGDFTSDLVILALTHGFKGIDTAGQRKHYREDHIGLALQTASSEMHLPREELWIQTKFTPQSGQDWTHPAQVPYGREENVDIQVKKSFAASMRNLHPWLQFEPLESVNRRIEAGKDDGSEYADSQGHAYIDSYVLHSSLTTLERTLKVWSTMETFVRLGLVKQIGVSNVYDPDIFQAISKTSSLPPTILQNRWHYSTGHDVALLSLLSPTLSPNDFPSRHDSRNHPLPVVYQPFWSLTGNPNLLASVTVQDLAIKKNLTPQQVVYAFLARGMNIPGLHVTVLSGTTDEQHMLQAVAAVNDATLTPHAWSDDELDAVRKIVYGE
ncbi:Aldo/keto reductase [Testicularia cyperi]|uniref:Aldo/keto reductase n=1 Tax=Testicularia cyperi TaxID=1882483 RepID=A0A317XVB5_9BASI|nr:Aldo/keto reductase [Testicularia cyperi]